MDLVRVGRRFRALRHRLGWRQVDLARRAGVSQGVVSLIERGRLDLVSLDRIGRVALELDADLVLQLRWRGGDLDRLIDEGHAFLVGRVVQLLQAAGWLARTEVSYAVYGERGSIDILAFHPATRTLLVIEVKTELVSVEETIRKHHEKGRLAKGIADEQLGWRSDRVARILVLPDTSTARRRVDRHDPVFGAAYPSRGMAVRRWMAQPEGTLDGILWVDSGGAASSGRLARKRVQTPRASSTGRSAPTAHGNAVRTVARTAA